MNRQTILELEALHTALSINELVDNCHERSKAAGWWLDAVTAPEHFVVPQKLALVHSEVSEALEGHRKGLMDDKLTHRKMVEVELADAVIRIMDLAGYLELDLGGAIMEKLEFNSKRSDHKLENRAAEGGKKY